jgi:hypothetical protein
MFVMIRANILTVLSYLDRTQSTGIFEVHENVPHRRWVKAAHVACAQGPQTRELQISCIRMAKAVLDIFNHDRPSAFNNLLDAVLSFI